MKFKQILPVPGKIFDFLKIRFWVREIVEYHRYDGRFFGNSKQFLEAWGIPPP